MVQFLSGSAWSVTMRRIMENIMITLPVGALLFVPLAFGLNHIYPWTNPDIVKASAALRAKSGLSERELFHRPDLRVLRAVVHLDLCDLPAVRSSRMTAHSIRQMHIASRWSAPGLFLAVAVGTLAAYDWLMSVEPSWYSTIFGLYYLADGAVAFFAVLILICLGFRKAGILDKEINIEHYHDLGKWLFAMTCFYTYMGFSQFLLIWYANLPDETQFYRHRMPGAWLYISLSLPFIRFFIPFFALLSRPAKRNLKMIGIHGGVEPGRGLSGSLLGGDAGVLSQRSADSLAGFRHAGRDGQHRAAWCSGAGSAGTRWFPRAIFGWSRACTLRMRKRSTEA